MELYWHCSALVAAVRDVARTVTFISNSVKLVMIIVA